MNSRFLLLAFLALCISTTLSHGAVVKEGTPIDEVAKAMSKAGYNESGLDMLPLDQKHRLAFWSVDQGVLIVLYSTESKKVVSMSFWLSDERPKATRQTLDMNVTSFDTASGAMVVQTKSPKREQNAAEQPATPLQSKSK